MKRDAELRPQRAKQEWEHVRVLVNVESEGACERSGGKSA